MKNHNTTFGRQTRSKFFEVNEFFSDQNNFPDCDKSYDLTLPDEVFSKIIALMPGKWKENFYYSAEPGCQNEFGVAYLIGKNVGVLISRVSISSEKNFVTPRHFIIP